MSQPDYVFGSSEKAAGSPAKPPAAAAGGDADPALAMNYCPRCSARLAARSCKLICTDCGYYMSCSDFY